jgi:hypothetical protein
LRVVLVVVDPVDCASKLLYEGPSAILEKALSEVVLRGAEATQAAAAADHATSGRACHWFASSPADIPTNCNRISSLEALKDSFVPRHTTLQHGHSLSCS